MVKATTGTKEVTIPAINIQKLALRIVGDSPLIMHKWDEKAKREMLEKQMKKATKGKEAKNPIHDFIASIYWLDGAPEEDTEEAFNKAISSGNARFGFPSIGLKSAAVSAGYRAGVTKDKVSVNGAFHIDGEFVEIKGTPEMREDMVRISGGTADIRYRGEFKTWEATIILKFNANAYSDEQIINLFNLGGFACGIGEMRPEKGGSFGMFHVE